MSDKENIRNFIEMKIRVYKEEMDDQIDSCGGYVSSSDEESWCYLIDRIAELKSVLKFIKGEA